jgi:hypothetical protein
MAATREVHRSGDGKSRRSAQRHGPLVYGCFRDGVARDTSGAGGNGVQRRADATLFTRSSAV